MYLRIKIVFVFILFYFILFIYIFFIKYILVLSKELTWLIIILREAYYSYTAIMTINLYWQLNVLAHSIRYKIFSRWHFEVFLVLYMYSLKQILAFYTNCLQMIWHSMQIVSTGDNLHEMSNLFYGKK